MPLIFRVDCDNTYVLRSDIPVLGIIKKYLSKFRRNYWAPCIRVLGCFEHLYAFINYMENIGVQYSIFFMYMTIPFRDLIDRIKNKKNEIGLHLYSAKTYNMFVKELNKIRISTKYDVLGFTKHGDGKIKLGRKHAWRYEPDKYVKWGQKAGLLYFNGNIHGINARIERHNGFIHIPQVFYIEPYHRYINASVDNLVQYISTGGLAVALVHPYNWYIREDVKKETERLLSKVDKTYSFKDYLLRTRVNE